MRCVLINLLRGLGDRYDRRLFLHKGNKVVNKESALVYRCRCVDKGSNAVCDRVQRARVKAVVTDRKPSDKNAKCDNGIENAVDDRRYDRNSDKPRALRNDQLAKTRIVFFEYPVVPVDKGIGKIEDSDLFDKVLVDKQAREVGKLSAILRTPTHVLEMLSSVNEGNDSRGYRNDHNTKRHPPHIRNPCENEYVAYELDDRGNDREG